jgi:SAM-dependent methyltransferase
MQLKNCRICNKKFNDFINLGKQPCADTFLKTKKEAKNIKRINLEVGYCNRCKHMSNLNPVSGFRRYQKYDYSYTSNNSPVSRNHFKSMAKKLSKEINLKKNNIVIEAGSNDGFFLSQIKKNCKSIVIGIDPSKRMSNIAKKRGIKTINNFFNLKTAKIVKSKYGFAKLFYAANVLNHVDDINNFIIAIKKITSADSLIVIEVPDLENLIYTNGFDTIYHEHRQYFSLNSLFKIFNEHQLNIIKFEKISYMSGSLRIYVNHNNKFKKLKIKSTLNLKMIDNFKSNIKRICNIISSRIHELNKNKKIVICIGAATKGNTLLNCCDINFQNIKFILESSIHKIGKYTPGSAIRIIKEKNLNFDLAVILPWNISKFLIKKFNLKKNFLSIKTVSDSLKYA